MRNPKGTPCHECCPQEWRNTPDITGSFELDAVIRRNPNKDMAARLELYCEKPTAYGPRTGYDGYHGYSGDS